jgi:hypothetical protein
MKKNFLPIAIIGCLVFGLAACGIDNHNNAELKIKNQDDTRIYGERGEPARQTLNKYPADDDGKAGVKVDSIRKKMYPR